MSNFSNFILQDHLAEAIEDEENLENEASDEQTLPVEEEKHEENATKSMSLEEEKRDTEANSSVKNDDGFTEVVVKGSALKMKEKKKKAKENEKSKYNPFDSFA